MADDIASLGLDTTKFKSSLGEAIKSLDRFTPAAAKATKEVQKVSAAFQFGERVGKAFGNAIAGIGRAILHGFGIGSAIEFTNQLFKGYEAAKKFNEEVAEIGIDRSNPEFRSLDYFENRIDVITKKLAEIQKIPSALEAAGHITGKLFSEFFNDIVEGNYSRASLNFKEVAGRIADEKEEQRKKLVNQKRNAEKGKEIKESGASAGQIDAAREERANKAAWERREKAIKDEEDIAEEQKKQDRECFEFKDKLDREAGDDERERIKDLRDHEQSQYQDWLNEKERMNKTAAEDEKERIKDLRDHEQSQYQDWLNEKERMDEKEREDRMDAASESVGKHEEAIDEELKPADQRRAERREQKDRERAGRMVNLRADEESKVEKQNEVKRPNLFKGKDPRNGGIFRARPERGDEVLGPAMPAKEKSEGFGQKDSYNLQKMAEAFDAE